MENFFIFFMYFFIYSVLGWIIETLYCRILDGKWTNRGFLFGPYCPIYGFGALLIIAFLQNFKSSLIAVFILGMIFTSALEYLTSFLLEKLFDAKWWDYSKMKFNLNGRICLLNSIEFAFLGVVLTYVIHPIIYNLISYVPLDLIQLISIVLISIMAIDIGFTISTLLNLKEKLITLRESAEKLMEKNTLQEKFSENYLYVQLSELRKNLATKTNFQIKRLLEAFPDFEFNGLKSQINEFKLELKKIRGELNIKRQEIKEKGQKIRNNIKEKSNKNGTS